MITRRTAIRVALAAGLAALAITSLVISGVSTTFDKIALTALRLGPSSAMAHEALRDITALGSFSILALAVAGASGYLFAGGRWKRGAVLILSSLGATAVSSLLKIGIDRARPQFDGIVPRTFTASFPSGHAFLSAAILLTLGAMLAQAARQPGEKRLILAFSIGLTLMIGTSRVMLGVHWPSDVLAGWCFGTAWAAATLAFFSSTPRGDLLLDR